MPAAPVAASKKVKQPLKSSKAVLVATSDDDELAGPSQSAATKVRKGMTGSKFKAKGSSDRDAQVLDADADTEPENENEQPGEPSDMARRLAALIKENARLKAEKEAIANQFEALSTLKTTRAETLYEQGKKAAEVRATAQDDLIATLNKYNEKLQTKSREMERELAEARTALKAPVLPVDPKEIKSLKEKISKMEQELKGREEKISTLQREYDAEVSQSRKLLGSSTSAALPVKAAAASETSEKDFRTIQLYEDLTELQLVHVKIVDGENGTNLTYNCVQTMSGLSVNFKLQIFQDYDEESSRWVKTVRYIPLEVKNERDKDLHRRLGPFRDAFDVAHEELGALWDQLKGRISGKGGYDEMEVV